MKYVFIVLAVLILVAIGFSISTAIIFYAWNLVVSPIFHITPVTWLQAFLVALVVSIIGGAFKSSVSIKK